MERTARPARALHRVERVGLNERARIDVLDRVERGPGLIEGSDAVKVRLHQLAAGETFGVERGVHARDGGFHHVELLRGERRNGERRSGQREHEGDAGVGHRGNLRPVRRAGKAVPCPLKARGAAP